MSIAKLMGAVVALALLLAAPAHADDLLGLPCSDQPDGTRVCAGDATHRIPSFDGVPLDANIVLPPTGTAGPFPLVVFSPGFGVGKNSVPSSIVALAARGYAVLTYSPRGVGNSCGDTNDPDPACSNGYARLADVRYDARDIQQLAGLLTDAGVTSPNRIGVAGQSEGGAVALELAALKDRVVNTDYAVSPWTSPGGTPMAIAAAAPSWGWSDMASSLVPNGRQLDYAVDNLYSRYIGMPKAGFFGIIYLLATQNGRVTPGGGDFTADIAGWAAQFLGTGEPYSATHAGIIYELERHHSAYRLDTLPGWQKEQPAAIFADNAWNDDLAGPMEMLVYRNKVLKAFPNAEFDLLFSAGAGDPRATSGNVTPDLGTLQTQFFDRTLLGAQGSPLGVRTFTQGCAGSTTQGPFDTSTWTAQHPGEVRYYQPAQEHVLSTAGSGLSAQTDPFSGAQHGGCVTTGDGDEQGAAEYRLPRARSGYTILGSPTVRAEISSASQQAQLDVRLWDVAPDGTQAFITRVAFRPKYPPTPGPQVFQLNPAGWQVAAGHRLKLELVGQDAPYVKTANEAFN
ncbi:MAG: type transport system ATP-binding protein, partial [Solirubrobacteraceae bacterium]|nr:type transport system ATP-binding protein [Solirubrobacteraceae bacterium]